MQRSAHISTCKKYRWSLRRSWNGSPTASFIMLNPSTADSRIDDPTIRRCIRFANRLGCGSLLVTNLLALRASSPGALVSLIDSKPPILSWDLSAWEEALEVHGPVIVAWGSPPAWLWRILKPRADHLASMAKVMDVQLHALGLTKNNQPRHPLYLRADSPLIPWTPNEDT